MSSEKKPRAKSSRIRSTAPLDQAALLEAALAIADRHGLEGLTIRKLADAVGVTPMAIYRHFPSKAAITSGIVDRVVGESAPSEHRNEDWREWLRTTFARIRAALHRHPGVMPLLGSPASFGASALRVMSDALEVLVGAGLPEAIAVRGFYVLISYTVGAAAIETAALREGAVRARRRRKRWLEDALASRGTDTHPSLAALAMLAPYLADFPSDEQFFFGLNAIIDALDPE